MNKFFAQKYFTKAEAAEYLRCSIRTIDYLRERNELSAYKLSRKLLFKRNDLDALVEKNRADSDLDKIVDDALRETAK